MAAPQAEWGKAAGVPRPGLQWDSASCEEVAQENLSDSCRKTQGGAEPGIRKVSEALE